MHLMSELGSLSQADVYCSVYSADGPAASEEPGATEPDLSNLCVGEVSVPSSGSPRLQKPPHDCR